MGNGLVITAAHVVGQAASTKPSVRIADLDLPANAIKEGAFEEVDLTLLSINEGNLPNDVRLLHLSLCHYTPWPGDPVIVAVPEGTARSHIVAPRSLPPAYKSKFATMIGDVATTGNSGSGVFDARSKCLLGIMSGKIVAYPSSDDPEGEAKDIAKYFVPAPIIREFIPDKYRF